MDPGCASRGSKARDLWALAGITALGAGIRLGTLGVQSFDHDETATVQVVASSLGGLVHGVEHLERSPPLFYALAWLWAKLFGIGQLHLRTLAALIGIATIPIGFWAAKELGGSRRARLIAATFFALNPYLVWYSQELRSYGLMAMFATVGLGFFGRAMRSPSRRSLGAWAIASSLALCSHYFAAFLIAPEALWLLLRSPRRRRALAATAAIAVVGLGLLPLAIHQQGGDRANGYADTSLVGRAGASLADFTASEEPDPPVGPRPEAFVIVVGAGGALLLASGIALGLRGGPERERRGIAASAGIGLAAFALPVALALAGFDLFKPHNLIGVLPPLLLAAAIGFGAARLPRLGLAGAAVLCALFAGVVVAVNLDPNLQRPDWRGAATAIGPAPDGRAIVAPYLAAKPLAFYLGAKQLEGGGRGCVRVDQLDVLSTKRLVAAPDRGFELAGTDSLPSGLTLRRYRARRQVCLAPTDLNLLRGATIAMVQPPRR
ncbi:MAG: glycosyltransferase family 39 protein [Solirubrobacterales bacterium]